MGKQHDYGLTWINSEDLFRVTLKSFEKVFARANQDFDPQESKNAIDPFGAVFLMGATGIDYRTWVDVENSRQVGKTLQNAVGNWHQAVLGLAQGWQDKGANGTIYDIESEGEVTGFGENPQKAVKVIAEVKNKYNTIKASDEANTHKRLREQAKSRGNSIAYLIQIVPKSAELYERRWMPSNVRSSDRVYVMDGYTAYSKIFKYQGALRELYEILPALMQDVHEELGNSKSVQVSTEDYSDIQKIFEYTYGK
ncbi:Eco47II family restriction endonuclease [Rothia dentocariosa]